MNSFILLDTNVILDFAMKRGEHYVPAFAATLVRRFPCTTPTHVLYCP